MFLAQFSLGKEGITTEHGVAGAQLNSKFLYGKVRFWSLHKQIQRALHKLRQDGC